LPSSDIAIPANIGCRVRIGAGEVCIPGAGYPVSGITPINVPAIDRSTRVIFDGNAGHETGVPFIIDVIGTSSRRILCCDSQQSARRKQVASSFKRLRNMLRKYIYCVHCLNLR
jgi:hypothetical protein